MAQNSNTQKLTERKQCLGRHITALLGAIQVNLAYGFEQFYGTRIHAYFSLEEKLQRFEALFYNIKGQLGEATTLADVDRIADRLAYVEDRLDELESVLYHRPRKRKKKGFGDFFARFTQQPRDTPSDGGPASLSEAYQALGLIDGASLMEVISAFRRCVKEYHPDTHGGDRRTETHLRRAVSAYQYLKEHLEDQ